MARIPRLQVTPLMGEDGGSGRKILGYMVYGFVSIERMTGSRGAYDTYVSTTGDARLTVRVKREGERNDSAEIRREIKRLERAIMEHEELDATGDNLPCAGEMPVSDWPPRLVSTVPNGTGVPKGTIEGAHD